MIKIYENKRNTFIVTYMLRGTFFCACILVCQGKISVKGIGNDAKARQEYEVLINLLSLGIQREVKKLLISYKIKS